MKRLRLSPGPCAWCGKRIRTQKLWCSIECEIAWEKKALASGKKP